MENEIKQNEEFKKANAWLKENGKLTIENLPTANKDSIKPNVDEFQLTYRPNNGKETTINVTDTKVSIIDLYRELKE